MDEGLCAPKSHERRDTGTGADLAARRPYEPAATAVGRRGLFRTVAILGVAAAAITAPAMLATARVDGGSGKRRPRYAPDSADVQTYYRVNRYTAK